MKPNQVMSMNKKMTSLKWFCVLLLSVVLVGCSGGSGKAPVYDRAHAARSPVTSGQYVVKRGDTLYSIAFRFGWDWRRLAAHNGIRAPYLIVPGQVIRFSGAARAPVVAQAAAKSPASKPVATQSKAKPVSQPVRSVTKPKAKPAPVVAAPSGKWLWPASGAVVATYSSNTSLNKGIDIAGKLGQPIMATADGSVVYAGSGLRGYGELIIIKHNDTFISAYGHNRRLLVKEGQAVKAGQQIAEMGSTGTDRVKLHFEIRRQGKPVDPLQYLPKR